MHIVANKPTITRKEIEGVLDCLINGELVNGSAVRNFETSISNLINLRYSLAANSLLSAYHLSFKALEIATGDEVILPSYSDVAPLSALTLTGASPVIIDINENSFTPSIDQIKKAVTEKTKAIIVNHKFGFPFPVEELLETNIQIIEDISDVIDAGHQEGAAPGSRSSIAVASLGPGCLITTGSGGLVMTNNSRHFSTMKECRSNNLKGDTISFDYCLTDFQAAMGISQLNKLTNFIKRRREIAKLFYTALKFSPHKTVYQFSDDFFFQSFPILFDAAAEKIENYWKKCKIEVIKPISCPLHRYLKLRPMDFPNSERLANKLYTLPIYPTLTKKEIERISKATAKFI